MMLSDQYKARIQKLSGLLNEIETELKYALYDKASQKFPFNEQAMAEAIRNGAEIGLSFQSDNEKYRMPVSKYRIIHPVAMGYSKKGNLVIRAVHIGGQSEKKAIQTGIRSAEAQDEWRLLKAKNIKNMWLTGRYFTELIGGYTPNDSQISRVIATFNKNEAVKNQKILMDSGREIQMV